MPGSLRRSALSGAAAAVMIFGIADAMNGVLDIVFLLAASSALVVGAMLTRAGAPRIATPRETKRSERHSVAESLLANIPDPVILVDRRAVVIEANPAARALLPGLKLRHPLSFALRSPDVLDGIEEVVQRGTPLKTSYVTRVPTERAFEVQIGPLPLADTSGGGQPTSCSLRRPRWSSVRC